MNYARRMSRGLSKTATQCFAMITQGLIDKIEREGQIPTTYRFWQTTDIEGLNEELIRNGVMKYAFTDANGTEVFEHDVNVKLMRKVLKMDLH